MDTRIGLILTLLCASVVLAQSCDWTGIWDTNAGRLVLQQSDNNVTGSLGDYQVQGTVSDNHLAARWETTGATGNLDFIMATDCQSFSGNWPYGPIGYSPTRGWAGNITGKRAEVEACREECPANAKCLTREEAKKKCDEEKKFCSEASKEPCGCNEGESKFCFSPGCPTCAAVDSDWAKNAEAFLTNRADAGVPHGTSA
jgi:hypothetical protein